MEQEKHILARQSVSRVQGFDARRRSGEYPFIVRPVLGCSIGEVAQDRELQIGIAIGEILHLEMLERFLYTVHASQESRNDDRRHVLFGNAVVSQLELGHETRWHQQRYQLVDDADADLARRNQ